MLTPAPPKRWMRQGGELRSLVEDSFNPDLTTSPVYKIVEVVNDTRAQLGRAFEPAYEGSYLSTLAASVRSTSARMA